MRVDKAITMLARDIGDRIAAFRLSRNIRQEDIARDAGISRGAVARIEAGGGTIDSLLRVMKALGIEDRVEMLVPEARMSPLDPKSDTAPRLRARPPTDEPSDDTHWSWGS